MARGVWPLAAAVTALWAAVFAVSQVLADPPLAPGLTIGAGVLLTNVLILGYVSTLRGPRLRRSRRSVLLGTDPQAAAAGSSPSALTLEAAERTVALLQPLLDGDAVAITDRQQMIAFAGPGQDHHPRGSGLWLSARNRVFDTGRTLTVSGRDAVGCPEPSCPLRSAAIAPLWVQGEVVGSVTVYRQTENPPSAERVEGVAGILSLHLELAELQAEQRLSSDAKLEALRAQINPHFLFNTLNTIAHRVRTDPEDARQLLVRLADFFRYAIRQHGHVAEFAQEYAFVRTYVTLEQARFGDRLSVSYDVDPQVLGVDVPVLVIQPLVENAIKHGASNNVGRTSVRLRARVDPLSRMLDVSVRDDGAGMAQPDLDAVLSGDRRHDGSGVGLSNIAERLNLLYGGRHDLSVRTRPGEGTTVRLRLPMR